MPIEYMFCFICSEQCIKLISSPQVCFFGSVFKKNIPNNMNLTFGVGGVTLPLIFCQWHEHFSWNHVSHHQID